MHVFLAQSFAGAASHVAVFNDDTTFSANTFSTAGSVDVNTSLQGRPEDRLVFRYVDTDVGVEM